ncbi:hypothetical protein ElyMa_004613200 [Elysia marginata]|uniref:Uncharacterized protein n=1 Tax=Elysia marginata TaxID=1093978 RepID=A0AAV4I0N6_9GAST|nr:hypothetical protein ElyMa_004613200 [Elysia marginata]
MGHPTLTPRKTPFGKNFLLQKRRQSERSNPAHSAVTISVQPTLIKGTTCNGLDTLALRPNITSPDFHGPCPLAARVVKRLGRSR